jgi:hypothetical protein
MHANRDDVSRAGIDELAMASFAGALLDIPGSLQTPDYLTPCHPEKG